MQPRSLSALLALTLASAVACGASDDAAAPAAPDAPASDPAPGAPDRPSFHANLGDPDAGDAGSAAPGKPLGAPIAAPAGAWTWVDFPDSSCDDGTSTGIGLYLSPKSSTNLLVYFEGGGACWDFSTCDVLPVATHGPFGKAQFAAPPPAGTILAHADPNSAFNDWNKVYIPYCTADVHAGDAVQTYSGPLGVGSKTVHHKGHANVMAYLKRLGATFAAPAKVAVTGSSAGGGGALFNYPSFRGYWPKTEMMLIDDSLPLFEKGAISSSERDAWFASWNLLPLAEPFCGAGCKDDMSLWMKKLATTYPTDRMALLSSKQDLTIRTFYFSTPWDYETHLDALAREVLEPTGHFRHFFVSGDTHTMLGTPSTFLSKTTPLWTWLGWMESNDGQWTSVDP